MIAGETRRGAHVEEAWGRHHRRRRAEPGRWNVSKIYEHSRERGENLSIFSAAEPTLGRKNKRNIVRSSNNCHVP